MASPPCEFEGDRNICDGCNSHFRRMSCFDNHKHKRDNDKKPYASASDVAVRVEDSLHAKITNLIDDIVEIVIRETGHLCYMRPLKDTLRASDLVVYVFYDFKTTQNTKYSNRAKLHVPNLFCVQQFCWRY